MHKKIHFIIFLFLSLMPLLSSCEKSEDEIRKEIILSRIDKMSAENKFILQSFDISVVVSNNMSTLGFSHPLIINMYGKAYIGFRPNAITKESIRLDDDGTIHMFIPHCEALDLDISDRHKTYDGSLFINYSPEDVELLKRQGEDSIKARIVQKDLIKKTELREILFFKSMLSSVGFSPAKSKIHFND